MQRRYVALLRAIANVGMQPFREKMERMGFTDVESYGMSGNLMFNSDSSDIAALERRIAARLGADAFVRTRRELSRIAAQDPLGSIIMLLSRAPTAARRRALARLDFKPPRPVLRGKTVYFANPATLRDKRSLFNFERALGVRGTFRTARVVSAILARMSEAGKSGK